MERLNDDQRRTVIPRWRSLKATPTHELSVKAQPSAAKRNYQHVMDKVVAEWERLPTAITATEVADAVSLLGDDPRAHTAIAYLRDQRDKLRPMVTSSLTKPSKAAALPSSADLRVQIAQMKSALKDQPRNSIGHVEIALLYAVAGHVRAATNHMEIALRATPNSRYVLRSASRLFVHDDQPSRALFYLHKSDAVRKDPWVMAAEVATADLAGSFPKWGTRELKTLAHTSHLSIHYSELASALGVIEDASGSHKKARKLISRSLDQPTENSLAQAAWMSANAKREYVSLNAPYQETAYEAGVIQALHVRDFERADRFAWSWLNDEPFSSAPAIHGSYLNSIFTRSFERALAFAEHGLLSNPDDEALKNNRTYALIMMGRLDRAKDLLPSLATSQDKSRRQVFDLALHGLYHFKCNKFDEARRLYTTAVQKASEHHPSLYAGAVSHWLENEVLAGQATIEEFDRIAAVVDRKLAAAKLDTRAWAATKSFIASKFKSRNEVRTVQTTTGQPIRFYVPDVLDR